MSEFPKTLQAAVLYFNDPENTLATAIKFRWPEGVTCPHCGSQEVGFLATRRIWKCKNKECRKQFSAKVGTIFEDSPLGLDKWFVALWLLVNAKNGVSSWEVHRAVGVTQKTAWFMLHRLRLALASGSFEKLTGEVEADETYIGGKAKNMHLKKRAQKITGTGGAGKACVIGLLSRKAADRPSRVLLKHIENNRKHTVQNEVRAHVEPGSDLNTDALASYRGLDAEYVHGVVDHAVKYAEGTVHTNGMENFWSLLKRCIKGTYVSVDPVHLTRYLGEQAYRFNERGGNDQQRFIQAATQLGGKRLTYAELIRKDEDAGPLRGG